MVSSHIGLSAIYMYHDNKMFIQQYLTVKILYLIIIPLFTSQVIHIPILSNNIYINYL